MTNVNRATLILDANPPDQSAAPPFRSIVPVDHAYSSEFDDGIIGHCGQIGAALVTFQIVAVHDSEGTAMAMAFASSESQTTVTLDLSDFRRWLNSVHGYCKLVELEAQARDGGPPTPSPHPRRR
jgi:hypothetical protein